MTPCAVNPRLLNKRYHQFSDSVLCFSLVGCIFLSGLSKQATYLRRTMKTHLVFLEAAILHRYENSRLCDKTISSLGGGSDQYTLAEHLSSVSLGPLHLFSYVLLN